MSVIGLSLADPEGARLEGDHVCSTTEHVPNPSGASKGSSALSIEAYPFLSMSSWKFLSIHDIDFSISTLTLLWPANVMARSGARALPQTTGK